MLAEIRVLIIEPPTETLSKTRRRRGEGTEKEDYIRPLPGLPPQTDSCGTEYVIELGNRSTNELLRTYGYEGVCVA